MFRSVLPDPTHYALAALARLELIKKSYLAGGSALALQLGHRESLDLDFFTQESFEPTIAVQEFQQILSSFRLSQTAWGTILGEIDKVKFSLFSYQYPLITPTTEFEGIRLASKEDIAAMKLAAIADRGLKRDFIDLFVLLEHFSLPQMFDFYDRKFRNRNDLLPHLLKALVYFDDAERDIGPKLFMSIEWKRVKQVITNAVLQYRKNLLP